MNNSATAAHPRAPHCMTWPFPPGLDNFAAWRAALSRLVDCSIPATEDPARFDFHGRSWQLPECFVQAGGGSPMRMVRSREVIADRPNAQMALYLVISGAISTEYEGRPVTLGPGDIVINDYSRPYHSETSAYEGITITFDKATAPDGFHGDVHGLVLEAHSAPAIILGTQIRAVIDNFAGLSTDQAQVAFDGILRLAEASFGAAVPDLTRSDASVFERASRLARRRLADADFGPDELASALNVSRSKLFRSFADHGGVQRWLLGERLTASLQAMVRSGGKLKVSAIAHQHGFRSEAHFSRAFQKRYETSPSSVLALARQTHGTMLYLEWVETHANRYGATVEAWLVSALAAGRASEPHGPA